MMVPTLILLCGLFLFLVAAAPWFVPQREQNTLNVHTRACLTGKDFVPLSGGVAHFEWAGPENGPKVVLVHGFSSPMFIWDRTIEALAASGFRVLRYDLFGRGYSDRPRTCYNADLFVRQLLDLLDSQGVTGPIDIAGLSMGGAITVHFADRHPERVGKIVLCAPAGMMQLPRSSRLLLTPGLGEWILRAFGDRIIVNQMPLGLSSDPEVLTAFMTAYGEQIRYKGYKRALLRTMRDFDMGHMDAVYQRVGRQQRRGLLVWGDRDTLVPYALHARIREYMPWLDLFTVPGGGHAAVYESAAVINPRVIAFLGEP